MAQPFSGGPFNDPLPEAFNGPMASAGPMGPRWVEVRSNVSWSESVSKQSSPFQEVNQEPSPGEQMGQKPFAFPPPTTLRLPRPEELSKLKIPSDAPAQVLEGMREREGYKRYVNYPSRLFHLRPQSNLKIPRDLDWEKAFLWQKVSSPWCDVDWLQEFPYPALDLPLLSFPEAILRRGMTIRLNEASPLEALEFAAAVLKTRGRNPPEPTPAWGVPWRDVKELAVNIVERLEARGIRGAVAMAAKIREHQQAMDDYRSFFRFRDANRKPRGMGFRGTRDTLLLDDEYLTDFLNRAGQNRALAQHRRSDVKLVSFLNSRDAAKVTIVAVSAQAFREQKARMYLCYAIARTFPNLERLLLTSIGTTGRETARLWGVTPQQPRFAGLQALADEEIRRNGGSSFLAQPREDPVPLFDVSYMSPALIKATGAYADGRGRALSGEPSRTPLVAYGVKAGLLHDPANDHQEEDPPSVQAIQNMLTATFKVIVRRKEAEALLARLDARAKLEGRRTRLPRPVRSAAGGSARPAERLYRRSEVIPEDQAEWTRDFLARKARRRAAWVTDDLGSETDPDSEPSLPASEVGPADREYARVEPLVLIYDRDAFDSNVLRGWTGFGPGVDLSHFGQP